MEVQTYRYVLQDRETGRTLYNEEKDDIYKFMTISEANDFLVRSNLHVMDYELKRVNGADRLADLCVTERISRRA